MARHAPILGPLLAATSVALAARLTIDLPGSPVPVSLQTLAVVLTGAFLGPSRAAPALLLYLAAGALGLPVFADGGSGAQRLAGPAAGFLWSFPIAGHGVALALRRRASLLRGLAVFLLAHAGILALGGLGLLLAGRTLPATVEVLAALLPGAGLKSLAAWLVWLGFRTRATPR